MGTTLNELFDDPRFVATRIERLHAGVIVDQAWAPSIGGAVVEITYTAPPELRAAGYGRERARTYFRADWDPLTYPLGPDRRWKHRYPSPLGPEFGYSCGELCLWFPNDPRPLRWILADGVEDYVNRVHRHLFLEEHWRRTDDWPTEDTPHGSPVANDLSATSSTYPIATRAFRNAVRDWSEDRTVLEQNVS